MSNEPTQKQLKELLHYEPTTGVFTWRKTNKVAGTFGNGKRTSYIRISVNKKRLFAHRLAWLYVYGCFPDGQIDHINHDGYDNSINNLRSVTHSENHRNRKLNALNTTGITCVFWHKRHNKWITSIVVNYKRKHLGYFKNLFDACCVRKSAENKYRYHENHGS